MLLSAPEKNKRFATTFFIVLSVFLLSVELMGCSSKWKAPVSSYSTDPRHPKKPNKNTNPINSTYYRVSQGDTLYSIAWRTGSDYRNLAQWNRLQSPYTIFVGQVLRTKPPVKKASTTNKKLSKTSRTTKQQPASTAIKSNKEQFKQQLHWRWPTSGKIIKGFRKGDDTSKGVVLSGKVGQPVNAAEEGKVVYSGSGLIGYGQLIIVKHNKNYLSAYGHNRKILVKEGDWVTKGKKIAEMGLNETGLPALHFEIRKNGNPLNPVALLPKRN